MRLAKARTKTPRARPADQATPGAQPAGPVAEGLTREEDDELRRLHYFSQFGALAGQKLERFLDLRLHDRRASVRTPREFDEPIEPQVDPEPQPQALARPHPNIWLRRTPESTD